MRPASDWIHSLAPARPVATALAATTSTLTVGKLAEQLVEDATAAHLPQPLAQGAGKVANILVTTLVASGTAGTRSLHGSLRLLRSAGTPRSHRRRLALAILHLSAPKSGRVIGRGRRARRYAHAAWTATETAGSTGWTELRREIRTATENAVFSAGLAISLISAAHPTEISDAVASGFDAVNDTADDLVDAARFAHDAAAAINRAVSGRAVGVPSGGMSATSLLNGGTTIGEITRVAATTTQHLQNQVATLHIIRETIDRAGDDYLAVLDESTYPQIPTIGHSLCNATAIIDDAVIVLRAANTALQEWLTTA